MEAKSQHIDIISLMVQETFDNVDNGTSTSFDEAAGSSNCYDAVRKCFVLTINGQSIECPQNWGPFKDLSCLDLDKNQEFQLDRLHDTELFLDILSELKGEPIENVKFFIYDNQIDLVFNIQDNQVLSA